MKLRAIIALCCLARLAAAQQPACRQIEDGEIQGKDLAAAMPEFGAAPPETVLAASPLPGSSRTFHVPELMALAKQYAIHLEAPADICFAWKMQPVAREAIVEAMRDSLQLPDARIDIVEMVTSPAPPGRIEFPRERLGTPASADSHAAALWRGDIVYAHDRRFPIWARVRIAAQCTRLVATEPLRPGHAIASAQVRADSGECFPNAKTAALTVESVAGLLPLRSISAGAEVRSEWLKPPDDVIRGDYIQVEVRSGAARLMFTGKAETGGRSGDMIAVRNPDSNKIFQARVSGKARALVQAGLTKEN